MGLFYFFNLMLKIQALHLMKEGCSGKGQESRKQCGLFLYLVIQDYRAGAQLLPDRVNNFPHLVFLQSVSPLIRVPQGSHVITPN